MHLQNRFTKPKDESLIPSFPCTATSPEERRKVSAPRYYCPLLGRNSCAPQLTFFDACKAQIFTCHRVTTLRHAPASSMRRDQHRRARLRTYTTSRSHGLSH